VLEYIQILEFRVCQPSQIKLVKVVQLFGLTPESKSTTMGHIKRSDLKNSMVLIPTPEELIKMDKVVTPMIKKIVTNNRQISTLEKLRDNLLPKLMNGDVSLVGV
jgi:type I restriction enzyme, S subunit